MVISHILLHLVLGKFNHTGSCLVIAIVVTRFFLIYWVNLKKYGKIHLDLLMYDQKFNCLNLNKCNNIY